MPFDRRNIPLFAAFIPLYAATYWTSDVFRLPETGSTPWNPEAGLAVAALFCLGPRVLPVLAVIHFLCLAVWAPFSTLPWTAVLAAAHMSALAAVVTLRRGDFSSLSVPGSSSAARFVASALAATVASAMLQMLIALAGTDWSFGKILRFGMTVSVGNMVGIITVFPLLMDFPRLANLRKFAANAKWAGGLLLGFLLFTCLVVFGIQGLDQFKFFYLVFIPVMALALRDGMTGAVVAALTASIFMILVLALRDFNAGVVAELQFLMIVLSITGLVLGATIDERKRLHAESVAYLSRLQESEEALMRASRVSLASEMVAAVSHEIAQPLSAARSHVRALRRRLQMPRRNRGRESSDIDAAVQQIDSAAGTIRGMREFLRRGDLERHPMNLRDTIESATDLIRTELRRASVSLDVSGISATTLVMGNRTQVSQVLLNLVRNARDAIVESGARGGAVLISALPTRPGFIEVRVTDSGPGVAEKVRPVLFSPLRSAKPYGLGLGLSLSKSIITAHGGELWYDEACTAGTRFCFTLPVPSTSKTPERTGTQA
jgi:signal transduction histidine kinase